MIIKGIRDEDFCQYKETSFFIAFPTCTFKCEKESSKLCCQNSSLYKDPPIEVTIDSLVNRYLQNPITSAIVLGGLEPFDSFQDLFDLIECFRTKTDDTIVIYTGYKEEEIEGYISAISKFKNIIVKFGRFIPNSQSKFDEVLGVELASPNQYAKKIS